MHEKYFDDVLTCNRCRSNLCIQACPSWKEQFFETYSSRGRNNIIYGLVNGVLEYSPSLIRSIYTCTTCGNCKTWCRAKVDTEKIVTAVRADLVKIGKGPVERQKKNLESTLNFGNPYSRLRDERVRWLAGSDISKKGDILYYVGCTSAYTMPEIAKASSKAK